MREWQVQTMARGGGSKAFPGGKCWEVQTVAHDDPDAIATAWRATVEECAEWVRETGRECGHTVTVRGLEWANGFGWVQCAPPVRLTVAV